MPLKILRFLIYLLLQLTFEIREINQTSKYVAILKRHLTTSGLFFKVETPLVNPGNYQSEEFRTRNDHDLTVGQMAFIAKHYKRQFIELTMS
jgi:hypothetical protein